LTGALKYDTAADEELMRLVSRGDVRAFDAIYDRYSRRLLAYFTRMLNFNRSLAEDALQDLFLKIAEEPDAFDRTRPFRTWIYSVASNRCKNYYRSVEVRARCRPELTYLAAMDDRITDEPCAKMDRRWFVQKMWETIESLPHEKKEAFILKYQEEKSIAEIAQIQDCPEGSVKSRLHYAVKLLEQKLRIYKTAIA
jgi:RNA polymerase sigma-70 factor, ECF subfamily